MGQLNEKLPPSYEFCTVDEVYLGRMWKGTKRGKEPWKPPKWYPQMIETYQIWIWPRYRWWLKAVELNWAVLEICVHTILFRIFCVKLFEKITFNTHLSSASSATNNTIKLIDPPAANPDKNLPIYKSVAFVAHILANHANYYFKKINSEVCVLLYYISFKLGEREPKQPNDELNVHPFIMLLTPWGMIIKTKVYFLPNTSPDMVKNAVPIDPPK